MNNKEQALDYPHQVDNVLGFPCFFRGAPDVRSRAINEEMKVAAARALAVIDAELHPRKAGR